MRGPTLSHADVDTYLGAVDWLRGILSRAEVADYWAQPSSIADYTIGGVAAHAVHGVLWLQQLLQDAEPVGLRKVAVAEFFGVNRVEDADRSEPLAVSLRAGAEAFAQTGPAVVAATCTASRDELVGLLSSASATRAVAIIRVSGAQVPLSDYLPTRVFELKLIVHGDDIVSSIPGLRVPDPPPGAVGVSLRVCVELARARVGDMGSLRAFTRAERAPPDALRVL
jgi:hypothetical protein